MKCKFCKDDIKAWDTKRVAYVIATKHINGKIHIHGNLKNTNSMRDLVRAIIHEAGLTTLFMEVSTEAKKDIEITPLPDSGEGR